MTVPSPAAVPPSPLASRRHRVLKRTAITLYVVSALPLALWCAFFLYAFAKQRYDNSPVGPQVPMYLLALTLPALWAAGVIASTMLARRKKQWAGWAIGFALPVVAVLGFILVPQAVYLVTELVTYEPMPAGSFEPPAVPPG